MEWIIENWYVAVGLVALLAAFAWMVYVFLGLPTKSQISKIKEWLLWAVAAAEAELGSETGILKLRMVYDMFIARFPSVAKVITFNTFAKWVDEALDELKELLETSPAIAAVITGVEPE